MELDGLDILKGQVNLESKEVPWEETQGIDGLRMRENCRRAEEKRAEEKIGVMEGRRWEVRRWWGLWTVEKGICVYVCNQ